MRRISVDLKLSGGIAGYVSDNATCGISFQVGWAVQKADGYELADKLKNHSGPLDLRVTKVLEVRTINLKKEKRRPLLKLFRRLRLKDAF